MSDHNREHEQMAAAAHGLTRTDHIALLVGGAAATALSLGIVSWPQALWAIGLAWTMIAISISDARRFIVPDVLSLPAIPAGLLASGFLGTVGSATTDIADPLHIAAMAAGAAAFLLVRIAYQNLREREGLGLGDVKLAAVAGAWTGLQGLLNVVLAASLSALAFVALLALRAHFLNHADNRMSRHTAIPFGTFLAPAIWLVYVLDNLAP